MNKELNRAAYRIRQDNIPCAAVSWFTLAVVFRDRGDRYRMREYARQGARWVRFYAARRGAHVQLSLPLPL